MKITKSRLMKIIKEELTTLDELAPVEDRRGPDDEEESLEEDKELEEDEEPLEERKFDQWDDPNAPDVGGISTTGGYGRSHAGRSSRESDRPSYSSAPGGAYDPEADRRARSRRAADRMGSGFDENKRLTKESLKKFVSSEIKSLLEGSVKKRQSGG